MIIKEPQPGEPVLKSYKVISEQIKKTLHGHGIHSTTVQTEYEDISGKSPENEIGTPDELTCLLTCKSTSCQTQVCCPKR